MRIKLADIVDYLKSGRGIVATVSKETGISQDNLYKWKDGRGQPAGDDMVNLVEYLNSKLDKKQKDTAPLSEAVEDLENVPIRRTTKDYMELLEKQLALHEQVAMLKKVIEDKPHTSPPNRKTGNPGKTHKTPPVVGKELSDKAMQDAEKNKDLLLKKMPGSRASGDRSGSS